MHFAVLLIYIYGITWAESGDHRGKEFLLTFLENRILFDPPVVRLYITCASESTANVDISIPLMTKVFPPQFVKVAPNSAASVEFPYEAHMLGTGRRGLGVYVKSDEEIVLQGASINDLTSEAFLVLPVHSLGYEYYVMSYDFHLVQGNGSKHAQGPAQFGFVALYDDTSIRITFPKDLPIKSSLGIRLDERTILIQDMAQFESFQYQTDPHWETRDPTGTKLLSNRPFAAFSGAAWMSITEEFMGDHLAEQLLPTNTWGSEFLAPPIATRLTGDIYRVMARQNNTRVRVYLPQGMRVAAINDGEFYEFEGSPNKTLHVISNYAVQLAQFTKSYMADGMRLSDPFMTSVPPVEQYLSNYSFTTITSLRPETQFRNFISIAIERRHADGLLLDGEAFKLTKYYVNWTDIVSAYYTNFTSATYEIQPGFHTIRHVDSNVRFGATAYGLKFQEAYGHSLGQNIDPLGYVCYPTEMFDGDLFDNDCDGRREEEIRNDLDDDGDGLIDEDVFSNQTLATTPMTSPQRIEQTTPVKYGVFGTDGRFYPSGYYINGVLHPGGYNNSHGEWVSSMTGGIWYRGVWYPDGRCQIGYLTGNICHEHAEFTPVGYYDSSGKWRFAQGRYGNDGIWYPPGYFYVDSNGTVHPKGKIGEDGIWKHDDEIKAEEEEKARREKARKEKEASDQPTIGYNNTTENGGSLHSAYTTVANVASFRTSKRVGAISSFATTLQTILVSAADKTIKKHPTTAYIMQSTIPHSNISIAANRSTSAKNNRTHYLSSTPQYVNKLLRNETKINTNVTAGPGFTAVTGGYYDNSGKWVPSQGIRDSNGKFYPTGFIDEHGRLNPGGYYDVDGVWVPAKGTWDPSTGKWYPVGSVGPNGTFKATGYFDEDGRWITVGRKHTSTTMTLTSLTEAATTGDPGGLDKNDSQIKETAMTSDHSTTAHSASSSETRTLLPSSRTVSTLASDDTKLLETTVVTVFLQTRNGSGYVGEDGKFYPGGFYNVDGVWVDAKGAYGPDGKFYPTGYYKDGVFYTGGFYNDDGSWVAFPPGLNGFYDDDGVFHAGTFFDASGAKHESNFTGDAIEALEESQGQIVKELEKVFLSTEEQNTQSTSISTSSTSTAKVSPKKTTTFFNDLSSYTAKSLIVHNVTDQLPTVPSVPNFSTSWSLSNDSSPVTTESLNLSNSSDLSLFWNVSGATHNHSRSPCKNCTTVLPPNPPGGASGLSSNVLLPVLITAAIPLLCIICCCLCACHKSGWRCCKKTKKKRTKKRKHKKEETRQLASPNSSSSSNERAASLPSASLDMNAEDRINLMLEKHKSTSSNLRRHRAVTARNVILEGLDPITPFSHVLQLPAHYRQENEATKTAATKPHRRNETNAKPQRVEGHLDCKEYRTKESTTISIPEVHRRRSSSPRTHFQQFKADKRVKPLNT